MKKTTNRFSLSTINYVLMAVSVAVIVIGFVLMTGVKSTEVYNPDIFAPRYITVGPMISFAGFLLMIFAILFKPKSRRGEDEAQ